MRISQKLADMINAQIGHELEASNQYLQIAAYFDNQALSKLAGLFYAQSEEERQHALKFVHYLTEVGAEVRVPAIPAAKYEIASAENAFATSLDWEKEVTRRIHAMVAQAIEEKDYATQAFLQWYVTEQVEEEASMGTYLEVVRRAGEKNLLMVEAYLIHAGE
ncbi:MAG: ferritin [Chloroflexota bacterium]